MPSKFRKKFVVNGRAYWASGRTAEEAQKRAEERAKAIEAGETAKRDVVVRDWCDEWYETYKSDQDVNARYLSDIKGVVNKKIKPAIGSKRVKDVQSADLQKILNSMAEVYSQSYIKKVREILRQIFRAAVENSIIDKSPAVALTLTRAKPKRNRRAITDEERTLTLKVAETERLGLFILIMLRCGLRPGEVAALEWSDVDLKSRRIHVSKAVKADGSVGPPKSESGYRSVPIPEDLCKRLTEEKNKPPEERKTKTNHDLVCPTIRGYMYTKSSIRCAWESFRDAMDIAAGCKVFQGAIVPPRRVAEDLTMYCYRHTYCTDLQAAGVAINVARELMGHSTIALTSEIYTHSSDAALVDAADKINNYQRINKKKSKKHKKT